MSLNIILLAINVNGIVISNDTSKVKSVNKNPSSVGLILWLRYISALVFIRFGKISNSSDASNEIVVLNGSMGNHPFDNVAVYM